MSQKHKRVLIAIFQEPVSSNIHWREIESLLHYLGVVVQSSHGGRVHVVLNGTEGTLHRPIIVACVQDMKYVSYANTFLRLA